MNPTDWLQLGVEQYLRELPDDEFSDLLQRARPPGAQDSSKAGDAAFIRQMLGDRDR